MALFGPHVGREHARGKRPPLAAHIEAARREAATLDFKMGAAQVFLAGPRSFKFTVDEAEAADLRAYIERSGMFVVAHGTYFDFPWNPAKPYPAKFIRKELALCSRAGVAGLVVHLGKPDLAATTAMLPRLLWEPGDAKARVPLIYLETPALKPASSHYETPDKLAALFRAVRKIDPELRRFGVCIDTAHLWSCGVDLRTREAAEAWLAGLEAHHAVLPPSRIMFHLNDSCSGCGTGVDKHAPLLAGTIWGEYVDNPDASGLAPFVEYALRHRIPTILEHKKDQIATDYEALERLSDEFKA